MLVKEVNGQAGGEKRGENLAEGVIPAIGGRVFKLGVLLGVGARRLTFNAVASKVGIANLKVGD